MASCPAAAAEPEVVAAPSAVHIAGPECRETPLSIAEFVETLRVELAGRGLRCCSTGPGAAPDPGPGAAPGAGADASPAASDLVVTLTVEPCDPNTDRITVVVTNTRRP